MCLIYDLIVIPDFTYLNSSINAAVTIWVSENDNRIRNALNVSGNLDVPKHDYDKSVDRAEEKLIEELIRLRDGELASILDNLGVDVTVCFKEADLGEVNGVPVLGNTDDSQLNSNNKVTITLNRKAIQQRAVDLDATDDVVQERELYAKVFLETVIHEFCHLGPNDEPTASHDESNPAWYDAGFGRCQSLSYAQAFGQTSPDKILANGQNQRTTLTPTTIQTIFNVEQEFFKSTRSGVGAVEQFPTYDLIFDPDTSY